MSPLTPDQRKQALSVLREAEETVIQLERMVRRLETFTDHLDVLSANDGGSDAPS